MRIGKVAAASAAAVLFNEQRLNMNIKQKVSITSLAIIAGLSLAACSPEEVAIYNTLNPAEQSAVQQHVHATATAAAPEHNPPGGFLACVRRHESGGNYQAKNPSSTASGAYQFLDSTWRTMSARAGHGGWGSARYAPPWVQDAVAQYTVDSGWRSAWNGTGC